MNVVVASLLEEDGNGAGFKLIQIGFAACPY
jgi:hypothetical protein